MDLIVQKFGGSSVRDAKHLRNVAAIIADSRRKGNALIVVLSAQGDTTDDLLDKACELSEAPAPRELDALLAAGEQISVALCAILLEEMGLPAVSLHGWQVGIRTEDVHGDARILKIGRDRVEQELAEGKIVLVAGFQGIDSKGDITTLGRGGSDTTAVALAAAFSALRCEIYTDVDGVYTADPRLVPRAKKYTVIDSDEMLQLALCGAQVLHSRSVELARDGNVALQVLSSLRPGSGTTVEPNMNPDLPHLAGATHAGGSVSLVGTEMLHMSEVPRRIFRCLNDAGIRVLDMEQSDRCVSVNVGKEHEIPALLAVHKEFFEQ